MRTSGRYLNYTGKALGRVDIHPKSQLSVLFTSDFVVFFARYAASRLKKRRIRQENHSKSAKLPGCQHDLTTGILLLFFLCNCTTTHAQDFDLRSRLEAHIKYLASDSLRGRVTGSAGQEEAAAYIRNQWQSIGVEPIADNYYQTFEVITGVELADSNFATARSSDGSLIVWAVSQSYTPIGLSASGLAKGTVVFAGFGISSPKNNRDDYDGLEVKDRIVIILRGYPNEDNDPHSPLAEFAPLHYKLINAREKGAAGVVFVNTSEMKDELMPLSIPEVAGKNGIVAVHARRAPLASLFGGEAQLAELEKNSLTGTANKPAAAIGAELEMKVKLNVIRKNTSNIVGRIAGSDPALAGETIVVGAHYDHIGMGEFGSRDDSGTPQIHNGADDNASGSSTVIELARRIAAQPLARTVVFMAFTGEEMGLLGSAHYVEHPLVPIEETITMINLDMVGRLTSRKLIVGGTGTATEWNALVDTLQARYDLQISKNEDGYGPSDHSSFYGRDLPVISLFTGLHDDYHRPGDDWDKINYAGMDTLLNFTYDLIADIAAMPARPTFNKVAQTTRSRDRMSFRVRLGTIPDYSDHPRGLRITGVKPESPAEKAGLQGGDVIVKFDELEIKNIYDYTYALGKYSPGDQVVLRVLRDETEIELTVILEAL